MKSLPLLYLLVLGCNTTLLAQSNFISDTSIHLLEEVVVTGLFLPTSTKKTVNTVKIITAETIEKRGLNNLEELLKMEPNIRVSNDPILGGSVSINGIGGENVKICIDGVPIIGRSNGNIDASQIPLSNIKQVELIEGAQSLIFGSGASAGVINLITKSSTSSSLSASIKANYETSGYQFTDVVLGKSFGNFEITGIGGISFFRPKKSTDSRNQVWNNKDQHNLKLSGIYRKKWGNISFNIEKLNNKVVDLDSIKRPQFKPYAFDDYFFTYRKNVQLSGNFWLNQKFFLSTTLGYNWYKRQKESMRYDFEQDTAVHRFNEQDTSYTKALLGRIVLSSFKITEHFDFVSGIDVYNEKGLGSRLKDTNNIGYSNVSITETGIFSSIKTQPLQPLCLEFGGRYIYNSIYKNQFTSSVFLVYSFSKKINLKASFSKGFRSPSLKELYFNFVDVNHNIIGNLNLKPELSNNFKIEATFEKETLFQHLLLIQLTGFYNKIKDRIELYDLTTHYSYINISAYENMGGRLGFDYKLNRTKLNASFGYTGFMNSLIKEKNSEQSSIWSPDLTLQMDFNLTKSKNISLNIWSKTNGKSPFFYENAFGELDYSYLSSWTSLNSSLQYKTFSNSLIVTVGIKNILNKKVVRLTSESPGSSGGSGHINSSQASNVGWGISPFIQISFQLNHHKKLL